MRTSSIKQWQSSIWASSANSDSSIDKHWIIYGDSLYTLRAAALSLLESRHLTAFSNLSRSEETQGPPLIKRLFYTVSQEGDEVWYYKGPFITSQPFKLDTYQNAILHFVRHGLLPEKGPDFEDRLFFDGQLHRDKIKTFLYVDDEAVLNNYLQRGWHVVSTERGGEFFPESPKPFTKETIFCVGHPEEDAI